MMAVAFPTDIVVLVGLVFVAVVFARDETSVAFGLVAMVPYVVAVAVTVAVMVVVVVGLVAVGLVVVGLVVVV